MHKKHTSALEKALRCLDNDAITSEEIDPLKDDLDYYMVGRVCGFSNVKGWGLGALSFQGFVATAWTITPSRLRRKTRSKMTWTTTW